MKSKLAFVFDPERCTACEACRIACGIENNGGLDTGWRKLMTFNPGRHPALPTENLSLACNHCDTPACALGCPAKAYDRDSATGAVILDPAKCIGCRYCSWVCPYDAPRFDESAGVMRKCTFCAPRLHEEREPACVASCPTDALNVGERADEEGSPGFVGLGDFGLGPSLRIVERTRTSPSTVTAADGASDEPPSQPVPPRKITAPAEWPLIVFTVVMPALVAWFAGGLARSTHAPSLLSFLGLAIVAIAISTSHLGKPLRAWRAILNVGSSWLSREILFTNLFVVLGIPFVALPHASPELGVPALVAGVLLCISIDAVYRAIPRTGAAPVHSGEAIPTLALLAGIATDQLLVAWTAAVLLLVLYVGRWRRKGAGVPAGWAIARVALLVVAVSPIVSWRLGFLLGVAGAAIDRVGFYAELEPTSPARRMAAAMVERFAGGAR